MDFRYLPGWALRVSLARYEGLKLYFVDEVSIFHALTSIIVLNFIYEREGTLDYTGPRHLDLDVVALIKVIVVVVHESV